MTPPRTLKDGDPPVATLPVESESKPTPDLRDKFESILKRLNNVSVQKRCDAYLDIDWDHPDMALGPEIATLRLVPHEPLTRTDWYRGLNEELLTRLTLCRIASMMKIGIQFENVLQRGLLKLAMREPNDSALFRYVHHEIIEESQHSLMFQEFINRSGVHVEGISAFWRVTSPWFVALSVAMNRPLFFLLVLGGEEPVDFHQRATLDQGGVHPLTDRIMRIHISEEARHISFAKHWLRRAVPKMSPTQRFLLSVEFPVVMAFMIRMMIKPNGDIRRHCGLSRAFINNAYRSDAGKAQLTGSAGRVVKLADSLDLINPVSRALWKGFGLWSDPSATARAPEREMKADPAA